MRRSLLLLIAMAAALPATASARTIAVEQGRVHADAHGDRIAWSSFDPEARVWRLVTLEAGEVVRTRAPAAAHPFRLDVGPGPGGQPVAVYPRCSAIGECDLFLYDFERRRQRKLRRLSSRDASESLPTVWGRWVAFARRANGVSTLYRARLNGKRSQVLPSGLHTGPSGPLALEMRRRRVVFVWSRQTPEGITQQQLFAAKDGDVDVLDVTNSQAGISTAFVTPEIRGRRVFYARPVEGRATGNELRRVNLRTGRRDFARAPFRNVVTAIWRGERFLLSRALEPRSDDPEGECRPPGSDPAASVCRLELGRRVRRWTRRRDAAP